MSSAESLLGLIENEAARGEPLAVVRVLRPAPGENITLRVFDGHCFPPLADARLAREIGQAVRGLIDTGGIADVVEAVDEKGSRVRLVAEIIKPKLELVVFGAGHVGQAVALIAALTGYHVTVIDDREEFASRARMPDARIDLLVSDYAGAVDKLTITTNTAVVIVTRGHQYDELCLKGVAGSKAGYIGMIGSRRRVLSVFKKLVSEGLSNEVLQRVHAPIGLRIGAKSPQEIAVSILAEIINHVNNPQRNHKGESNGI